MKIRFCISMMFFFIIGCSAKPDQTINGIKDRAAVGDIQGVYSFFDKPKINDDLTKQIIKQISADNNFSEEYGIQKIKNESEDIIKLRVWDIIDDEVRKGKGGSIANIKILKVDLNNEYNANALIQLDNGEQTTLQLTKIDKKWFVTGMNLKDVVRNRIFKKIDAKPSLTKSKITLIEKYVGEYQNDNFQNLLKPELLNLVGSEYDTLIANMSVAGPIEKQGKYIIVQGLAPHMGGSEEGIVVIDCSTGILSAAIMRDGSNIKRYSDIKSQDDYPDIITNWNKR